MGNKRVCLSASILCLIVLAEAGVSNEDPRAEIQLDDGRSLEILHVRYSGPTNQFDYHSPMLPIDLGEYQVGVPLRALQSMRKIESGENVNVTYTFNGSRRNIEGTLLNGYLYSSTDKEKFDSESVKQLVVKTSSSESTKYLDELPNRLSHRKAEVKLHSGKILRVSDLGMFIARFSTRGYILGGETVGSNFGHIKFRNLDMEWKDERIESLSSIRILEKRKDRTIFEIEIESTEGKKERGIFGPQQVGFSAIGQEGHLFIPTSKVKDVVVLSPRVE